MPNPLGFLKVADGIMGGIDALFTSKEERINAKQLLIETLQKPDLMQAMINLEESKSPSKFKSWWRPALGWLCVTGLTLHFLAFPLIEFFLKLKGINIAMPVLDTGALMSLVFTLLGVGTMRSFEKWKGLTK